MCGITSCEMAKLFDTLNLDFDWDCELYKFYETGNFFDLQAEFEKADAETRKRDMLYEKLTPYAKYLRGFSKMKRNVFYVISEQFPQDTYIFQFLDKEYRVWCLLHSFFKKAANDREYYSSYAYPDRLISNSSINLRSFPELKYKGSPNRYDGLGDDITNFILDKVALAKVYKSELEDIERMLTKKTDYVTPTGLNIKEKHVPLWISLGFEVLKNDIEYLKRVMDENWRF